MTVHNPIVQPLRSVQDSAPAPADSDAIDLRQLQDFFWRRWKVILAAAGVVLVISYLVVLTLTPRYTASAQVLLEPKKDNILGTNGTDVLPEFSLETGNVDSQVSVIRSTALLSRVVDKLQLTKDPEFGLPAPTSLLSTLFGFLHSSDEAPAASAERVAAPEPDAVSPDVLRAISRLRGALDVQRVQRTYVLSISVTSEDPAKAARLANAVADAYVVDQLDARYDAAKRAADWLAERMEEMRGQVQKSEEAVASFRRDHNLLQTSSDAKVTVSEQQLSDLNGQLATTKADVAEKLAKYQQAQQIVSKNGDLQAIPDVVRSTVISGLRGQQAEVSRKVADLAAHYNDNHPLLINARAEQRNIDQSISAEVSRIVSNLKNDYDVAKARQDSLQKSMDQLSGATGTNDEVGVQLRALERTNEANKTIFDSFLSRAKISEEQTSFENSEARVITPAVKPNVPSFPRKDLVLSLALVVGLLVGTGGSVALEMLNSGFTTPKEIEEKLGVPVLASVVMLKESERTIEGKILDPFNYLRAKPLSRFAESFRAIRVGIQMSDVDHPAKVILVTSSTPQEGKTTLSISLAFSAVKAGLRVALVDCDLRHPSITRAFGFDAKPGLTDLLTGVAPPEAVFQVTSGLVVIPAGTKSQNPPDLLGSARMREFVDKLREHYDYIVIDTPPVGPVVDAKVLGQIVDKIIYSVRFQSTTREIVSQNLQTFAGDRKFAGVVLNLVDESKTPRYGPYSYAGGYYYNKYYQN